MAVDTKVAEQLARIAKALADPIRLKMLGILGEGRECCDLPDPCTRNVPGEGTPKGICVCEFQEQFGLGQSRTSYHLRVLKDAGLVTDRKDGRWVYYSLDRGALEELAEFVADIKVKRTGLRLAPRRCD